MITDAVFELIAGDDVKSTTSYSIAEIWEMRHYLSGNADYKHTPDLTIPIIREEDNVGQIIMNTGIDSPAVEVRPTIQNVGMQKLIHAYFTQVTSVHDYNQLVQSYTMSVGNNGKAHVSGASQTGLDIIKDWALKIYSKVVKIYTHSCELGLCQALTNKNG
jgi:hypothetical protein